MIHFLRIGGFSMLPVLLLGITALLLALYASVRPRKRVLALVDRLALALLYFAIGGVAANVAATFYAISSDKMAKMLESDIAFRQIMLTGLYESLAPVIMGFAFLGFIHLTLGVARYGLESTPEHGAY